MADLKVQGVVHWSIPVNNLESRQRKILPVNCWGSSPKVGSAARECHASKPAITIFCFANARTR